MAELNTKSESAGAPDPVGSRIRVLIYEPYIFNIYGNTRYLLSIFKYYDRAKYKLILCSPYEHAFLDMIRTLGGECLVLKPPQALIRYGGSIAGDSFWGRLRTLIAIFRYGASLAHLLRDKKIDIVQCHSIRSLLTIGWCARCVGKPCFWYVKGDLSNGLLDRVGFLLASRVFFQSPLTRDRKYPLMRRALRSKIGIIPNGIDLAELETIGESERGAVRAELNIRRDRLNIAVLGQVSPLKGSDVVVEALVALKQAGVRFHCYFVGDHVLEQLREFSLQLEKRVSDAGLTQDVTFVGWRPDATVILSAVDLLVHASLSEGVPKAVIEAMALGIPVIATNVGGTGELVENELNGLLIEPQNTQALVAALVNLAGDPAKRRRFSEKSFELARKKYSVKDNVGLLERIYDELAAS